MLADSTNAERPGITQSEQLVASALKRIIRDAPGRVIVTSFSSHIHRLQGVIDASEACGRKVAVVGRSMIKNLNIARNLGYADVEDGTIIKPNEIEDLPDDQVTVLCTGSQGEPMSALTRIAYSDHRQVQIQQGDTVIMSAKPVPGNELAVHDTMNALTARGARVLHQDNEAVHVSGHGSAEELKMMLALVHPRAFMPVHGELRMLAAHADLAESVGVPADRIHVCDNGDVLVLERGSVRREGSVEAGVVFVDGLGIGDPKDAVLRDRRQLSADGTLIVVCQLHRGPNRVEPEVIARGFAPGARRRRRAARRGSCAREHDPRPPRRRRRARAQAAPEPPPRRARRARLEPGAQAAAGTAGRRRRLMEYRQLGRSGLRVSTLTLGTMTFGGAGAFKHVGTTDRAGARRIVDHSLDAGVNLVDTADGYSDGLSEEILGEAIKGRRDRLLVATKARFPTGDGPNDEGLSRHHLIGACEASLRRLGVEHIDLYQAHEWDGVTPLEETVEAFDTLVQQGKVRYVGCSNFSGWHL